MSERMPLLGESFPAFEANTTHGPMKLPDAFSGKWFVLFSHPADFTPVCTTEFISFQKRYGEFRKQNCELIGLSLDQVYSHMKWTQWIRENMDEEIEFPIIADDMGRISSMIGLIHPAKGTNTVRAVFVVDPEAIIRAILYYPQELGRNLEEILRMVKGFQVVDKEKVALPANWPYNELIKDGVILPPPTDEETARKRAKEFECYDWWFCHKRV